MILKLVLLLKKITFLRWKTRNYMQLRDYKHFQKNSSNHLVYNFFKGFSYLHKTPCILQGRSWSYETTYANWPCFSIWRPQWPTITLWGLNNNEQLNYVWQQQANFCITPYCVTILLNTSKTIFFLFYETWLQAKWDVKMRCNTRLIFLFSLIFI